LTIHRSISTVPFDEKGRLFFLYFYINAESVCQLLTKLAERGLGIPITLILDNARYQRCHLVQQYAAALGIELLYLPPYSPNLNLIERLWKPVGRTREACPPNEEVGILSEPFPTAGAIISRILSADSLIAVRPTFFVTFGKDECRIIDAPE
jgi:Transposase and inactivated derivatives